MGAPSDRQLRYLKGLGYDGPAPQTSKQASAAITMLERGKDSKAAARAIADERKAESKAGRDHKRAIVADFREEVRDIKALNKHRSGPRDPSGVVGLQFHALPEHHWDDPDTDPTRYHRAFVLLADASKCAPKLPLGNMDWTEVTERRWPGNAKRKTHFTLIQADGEPVPAVSKRRSSSCAIALLFLLIAFAALIWITSRLLG